MITTSSTNAMMRRNDFVRFFRDTGYVRLSGKIPEPLITSLQKKVDDCILRSERVTYRNDGKVIRIPQAYQRFEEVRAIVGCDPVSVGLQSLMGPNIELLLNRHNHITINLPGANTKRFHRDVLQWSRPSVTALIYFQDNDVENGCTHLIPSSQYLPFIDTPNNGGTWMDEHEVFNGYETQSIPIPMRRGEVLLLDSLAFHSPGYNASMAARSILALGFHSIDELLTDTGLSTRVLIHGSRFYKGNDKDV